MHPLAQLPPPLSVQEFYVLLALMRDNSHAYGLISRVADESLGSVGLAAGTVYPLLERMHAQGFIDIHNAASSGPSGKKRRQYGISDEGTLRLTEELLRIRHAYRIGKAAGLFDDETPTDIRRLLLNTQ